ncbi:hypothetical protein RHMOL_Rhmol04G0066500 [Rhododendron molle]|uniref:Uncharacterized protein n=1 Tax=Rhododendron molle TaxID=49168 RepID=A0ACC0NXP6_RHOML|nr:hypothetical protein RHMOL_Rhmol04G0066500 [Rhododendron molle]
MRRSKRKASHNTAAAAAVPTVTISDLPNHMTCDILSRLSQLHLQMQASMQDLARPHSRALVRQIASLKVSSQPHLLPPG